VIDTDKHKKMIVELADHCTKNETHGVITAADTPFQKKK
jgi:hypothetical protein